jgi:integrase/recombinase XerD
MRRLTMRQLLLEYRGWALSRHLLAESTLGTYSRHLRLADKWLESHRSKSLWRASQQDLEDWLTTTTPMASTRNNRITALRHFFLFLESEGHRNNNPTEKVTYYPVPDSLPKALSKEEATKVFQAAKRHSARATALVALMLFGGLRRENARKLRWDQIQPDGWLRFKAKGRKDHMMALHPKARAALASIVREDPVWVFPSPRDNGQPISTAKIAVIIKEVGAEAGVPSLSPHVLRHTFATRMNENGTDLRTIQEAMNHRSIATTERYTRVRSPRVKTAVHKLDF